MTTRTTSPGINTSPEPQRSEQHLESCTSLSSIALSSIASFASPVATTPPALVATGDRRTSVQSAEALRQGSAGFLAPDFKGLQTCGEPIHLGLPVPLYISRTGTFYFGGLRTCGSVTACPVCSWRIMRQRQRHLMDCHRTVSALDGSTLVFHLTAGYPGDIRVAEQRERLQAAYAKFSGGNNRGRQGGPLTLPGRQRHRGPLAMQTADRQPRTPSGPLFR